MTLSLNWEVSEGEERKLEVTGNYSAATPHVYYLSNGDPGYPGDPSEFEILEILDEKGPISEELFDKLTEDDKFLDAVYDKTDEAAVTERENDEASYADAKNDAAFERERNI